MTILFLFLKVTFTLYITRIQISNADEADLPISENYLISKREDIKNIDANKINIVLKITTKDESCQGNNGLDQNSLNNLIPSNSCKEVPILPTICEQTTTCAPTISEITTVCEPTTEAFTCTKEGTFGDPGSCDEFFICHRKNRSDLTLESIKLMCPSGTAFDQDLNKCTKRAKAMCQMV